MRYALINNGVVVNIIEADAAFADSVGAVPGSSAAIGDVYSGGTFSKPGLPPLDRQAAAREIDDAVAAVFSRFTRFEREYTARESEARTFKAANYTGDVPPRVQEFAIPARLTAQQATDRIILQADALKTAEPQLFTLRMRKYEVLRAPNDADARLKLSELLGAIQAINAALT